MKASIITVPERYELALSLKEQLEGYDMEVHIFNDEEKNGCTWNTLRAITYMTENTPEGDPILFCTDDTIICEDFLNRFNELHSKANKDIYSLTVYSRTNQHHESYKEQVRKNGFIIIDENSNRREYAFSDIGWILYNKFGDIGKTYSEWSEVFTGTNSFLDNLPNNSFMKNRFLKKRREAIRKHFDLDFGTFLIENKIEHVVPIPGLCKHNGDVESTLGHRAENGKFSFIDDEIKKELAMKKMVERIGLKPIGFKYLKEE